MAQIACIIMMKNERTLLEPWLLYHAGLFGLENLYLFDNGSTDQGTIAILRHYEEQGLRVDRFFRTDKAYGNKHGIVGSLIKSLDELGDYDFFVPLDCDEFIVLRDPESPNGYSCAPETINRYFDSIGADEGRVLMVDENLMNIPGRPGEYRRAPYSKTIYPKAAFVETDHGYHGGVSSRAPGYRQLELSYVHFHFRPYEELVKFARQKLLMALTPEQIADPVALNAYRGPGFHMIGYLTNDAESYYNQFRFMRDTIKLPALTERFAELGMEPPFSRFELPPEKARSLVVDHLDRFRLAGWARDRTNPTRPLRVQVMLDGHPLAEVLCDEPRADVAATGYETDRVGFAVSLPDWVFDGTQRRLTVCDSEGQPVTLSYHNIDFDTLEVGSGSLLPIESHIDGEVEGGIQGWLLAVSRSDQADHFHGRCEVILVRDSLVLGKVTADRVRPDVAAALGSDLECGFRFELPPAARVGNFRIFAMPGMRELHGSPFTLPAPVIHAEPTDEALVLETA